jgi:glycosyltransferase involved in cell wall biosynthesis
MNLVINAYSARLGGGQTYLINLLKYLPAGDDLSIFIFAPSTLELPKDSRIIRMQTRWPTTNPLARAAWEKLVFPFILRKLRADVLFCPGGVLGSTLPPGCKSVTMFRNMMPFDKSVRSRMPLGMQRVRNWMLERVMLKSMSAADLVIFISEFARAFIERKITPRSAVTIPHGISDHFRAVDPLTPRPAMLPDGPFILYVSRFEIYKHHLEVVKAYDSLSEAIKSKYKLVLIGESDSISGDAVRAFIEARKLESLVLLPGPVEYRQLPAVYRDAEVVLFASSCENCPNILLEALASGRPVLSSSVMPMPEFGGDAVGYFDPSKPEQIARAMTDVLCDPDKAARMAGLAQQQSQRYHWKDTAARTWQSIATVAGHE